MTTLDLPDDSAAIILHADGVLELNFPAAPDDAEVPRHIIALAAVSMKMADIEWMVRTIEEFKNGNDNNRRQH